MFNKYNAQMDLMIVVKAMRYYDKDGHKVNLDYEVPIDAGDNILVSIERFLSDGEYLNFLEYGNKEGFSE